MPVSKLCVFNALRDWSACLQHRLTGKTMYTLSHLMVPCYFAELCKKKKKTYWPTDQMWRPTCEYTNRLVLWAARLRRCRQIQTHTVTRRRHQMETFSALLTLCAGNWIHPTKASDAELLYFLWSSPEQTAEQTIETQVIWDAIALIMTSL